MAPKRSAKKAALTPSPPAASSEETDSRSRSEESEDEDATVESSPPAPNNMPAPPHKGDDDDEDEEEEEDDDDEESDNEEEPAHAAPAAAPTPNNLPPPPQQREGPETSDEEEEEDDESEDAEEPDDAAPAAAPTPKNQPPPPQQREDPETSDEEEEGEEEEEEQPPLQQTDEEEEETESEEEEEEALPKLAPKQEPEGVKPQAVAETKKPAAFSRIWSTDDDVCILEALAAHQKQHSTLPQPDALADALAGKLDNRAYGSKELQAKVGTLKRRYLALSNRGELPSKEHDRRVLDLSKIVWGGDKSTAAPASIKTASNGHKRKSFEEMCELFPYLAEEVKELMVEIENPGMFKREFGKMDDEKARVMNDKIKRQRVAHLKVGLRRQDLTREVTKAIIDLVD